jgi:hypothetical protein
MGNPWVFIQPGGAGKEIHLIGGHGELVEHTGSDGGFLFPDVPPNNYQLTIVSHGHEVGHARLLPLSAPTVQPSVPIGTKLVLVLKQSRFTLDGRNVGVE